MRERKHRKGLPAAASLRGRRLNVSDMSLMAFPARRCERAYNRKLVNQTIRAPGRRQTPQSTRTLMRSCRLQAHEATALRMAGARSVRRTYADPQ